MTLWAQAPQLFNPTAIDTDARGRIWVAEAVNYRRWRGRNPGLEHAQGDRIVVLEDSDGDGRADRSSVFAQDADLVAPLGLCVLDENRVLVSCSPNAFLYTDTDGDGHADQRETFLTGFGGHDHDHGLHSFVLGPDGRLYVAVGNAGPHLVRDRDGRWLRSGSLYNDGGAETADNKPALESDDGRVWTGGLILSFDARGGDMRVHAHNFRNNYEVAVDAFGDLFCSDNDDDGHRACRALWVLPRSNNGYFSADGARFWGADRRPGQDEQRAHWHQDDPGVAPMGTLLGAGGPTGVALVENAALGAECENWMLAADAGAGVVYALEPSARGAAIELTKRIVLSERADASAPASGTERAIESGPRPGWFRPSDVLIGTDGALYVADWYDPGVGGHAMGDREAYGRILRVARSGTPPAPVAVDLSTPAACLRALSSAAANVRGRAARKLIEAPEPARVALAELPKHDARDPRWAARLDWLHASLFPCAPDAAELAKASAKARIQLRANGFAPVVLEGSALPRDAALQRDLSLALEGDRSPAADRLWAALAREFDPADRAALEALGIGAYGCEQQRWDSLSIAAPEDWDERTASLAWRLHPESAVDALAARAKNARLEPGARRQALDALAFMHTRAAAEAVLDLAVGADAEIQAQARWWTEFRANNAWRAFGLAAQLAPDEVAKAQVAFRSDVMRDGSAACEVDVRDATRLVLAVEDAGDGNGCDWADWFDAVLEGPEGTLELCELEWSSATAAWGKVQRNANCAGGPLSVARQSHARGIGAHADSSIVFALPPGRFERFRARFGPDDAGVAQGCGTSVRFVVSTVVPFDQERSGRLQATLQDLAAPDQAREQAARELCSTREGGLAVLALAERGALDVASRELLARSIFDNPDLSVRGLASEYFPRAGAAALPRAALEALRGDDRNGERLFFSARAACSRCHAVDGRGGDIGPDLGAVRAKLDTPALFDAILNPSAGIAFGYDTWMLETDDGRVVSGFLLSEGETVIVKDSGGVRTSLERDAIVARRKARVSTMPDNLSAQLEAQELADVVAFLRLDRHAERPWGPWRELFNARDLDGWVAFSPEGDAAAAQTWSVQDGVLDCRGSPLGYLRTEATYEDFELVLEWRFPPGAEPGNSGVLLRQTGAAKVWPHSVEAQLQHRWAGDIWNIDEVPLVVDAQRTSGRRTQRLWPSNERPLGEWNHYRISLVGGSLRLEVNGTLQNQAEWVERVPGHICLQSEGARIQFRNVKLRLPQ